MAIKCLLLYCDQVMVFECGGGNETFGTFYVKLPILLVKGRKNRSEQPTVSLVCGLICFQLVKNSSLSNRICGQDLLMSEIP